MFKVIEKQNPLAVHALCDSKERAQYWIDVKAPEYAAKGYFMAKEHRAANHAAMRTAQGVQA